jgi:hypothetical protein
MKIVTRANMSAEAKLYGRGVNILRKMREKVLPGDQINTIIEDLYYICRCPCTAYYGTNEKPGAKNKKGSAVFVIWES